MKINFVTFSDKKFKDRQKNLTKQAEGVFDVVHEYGREWLTETEFYRENRNILDQNRGAGFCLWKPFIVLETLKTMKNGDVLFYLDSADTFRDEVINYLKIYFSNENNEIILTDGAYINMYWTKYQYIFYIITPTEKKNEAKFHKNQRVQNLVKHIVILCINKINKFILSLNWIVFRSR